MTMRKGISVGWPSWLGSGSYLTWWKRGSNWGMGKWRYLGNSGGLRRQIHDFGLALLLWRKKDEQDWGQLNFLNTAVRSSSDERGIRANLIQYMYGFFFSTSEVLFISVMVIHGVTKLKGRVMVNGQNNCWKHCWVRAHFYNWKSVWASLAFFTVTLPASSLPLIWGNKSGCSFV